MSTRIQRSALLPYPARALYDLINDVASYPQFLPWCSGTEVLESTETRMRATLKVGKAGIKQQFTTCNHLVPGESITMQLESGPFRALHGVWTFHVLNEEACKITLDLSFEYSGALVKATLGPLFNQAATTMVEALCQRARALYG